MRAQWTASLRSGGQPSMTGVAPTNVQHGGRARQMEERGMAREHGGGPDARHAAGPLEPERSPRRWPWFVLTLVVVVGGWSAWLFLDAVAARRELNEAASMLTQLQDDAAQGDAAAAAATLHGIQAHAQAGRDHTRGPHWSAAAALPWIGPNVAAVQTAADVVDDLATQVLPELLAATRAVDPSLVAPSAGALDTTGLADAGPAVSVAHDAAATALDRLDEVDGAGLWGPVAEPFDRLRAQLASVASTTSTAARTALLLPPMLGADGPRDYLVLVQDGAELRATGGVPRTAAVLHADGGVVTLTGVRSVASLGALAAPALPLSEAESRMYGPALATDLRNATLTPDVPRAAQVAAAIWKQAVGTPVDGVVLVDAATIALLLDDVGPVPLTPGPVAAALGGQLVGKDAATALLSVDAAVPDPVQRDAFLGDVVTSVVNTLLAEGDRGPAVEALAEAARQGRLSLWSAHPEEQKLLAGTVLAGDLLGSAGTSPVVGVYFDDATQAKLDGYLMTEVAATAGQCRADGSRVVDVTVTMTNTLAPDAVAGLPAAVLGTAALVPPGEVRTDVLLVAPTDGRVESTAVAGVVGSPQARGDDAGTVVQSVQLAPGASAKVTAQMTVGPELTGRVLLRTTPASGGGSPLPPLPACG